MPPATLYVLSLLSVLLLCLALGNAPTFPALLRPVLLLALQMPMGAVAYALASRSDGLTRLLAGFSASALLAVGLDMLLPGGPSPAIVLWIFCLWSLAAAYVGGWWRRRWEEFPAVDAVLVAPTVSEAEQALAGLREVPGLQVVSVLVPGDAPQEGYVLGVPVRWQMSGLPGGIRRAIVSSPRRSDGVRMATAQLVALGYDIESESAVMRTAQGRVDSRRADPLSLILGHRPNRRVLGAVCRVRDLTLSLPALLLLSPLFAVIGLLVKLDSRGPIFFRQRRLGFRGKPFDVVKFRTMVADAEASTGPVWAQQNDPRITRLGRFLRHMRIDELPQLYNVVRGEMSLVGPRPERQHFFDALRLELPIFELRTVVPPGLTGWAQIRAPYAADVDDARVKLECDLFYLTRRGFWYDAAIIFETVTVALAGQGAR